MDYTSKRLVKRDLKSTPMQTGEDLPWMVRQQLDIVLSFGVMLLLGEPINNL